MNMRYLWLASVVAIAFAASSCMDLDAERACKSNNDCAEGHVCDHARKVCVDGARDTGVGSDVGEPRSDGGGADVASVSDAGQDAGVDAAADTGVDSGIDTGIPADAGPDAGPA